MMVVLDASALLAYLRQEPGAEVVQMSLSAGVDVEGMQDELQSLGMCVEPFLPVAAIVQRSGIADGLVSVYAQGATAAVMIQENWDESVQEDVIDFLRQQIPKGVWKHDAQDGHGDAHLKAGLLEPQETIPRPRDEVEQGDGWPSPQLHSPESRSRGRKVMIAVPHYISPKDYLDIERDNPVRLEYRRGLVYAMAGGSDNHDRIALNLLTLVNLRLGDSACRFHSGNVKVNYQDAFYYYPDAFVTCDPRDRDDRYIKRYPKLIVEVLSSSTEHFDLGEKFEDYKQLESLQEYVLISQESQRVECRRRTAANTWETTVYGEGERVTLTSIDLEFAIAELFRGLDG